MNVSKEIATSTVDNLPRALWIGAAIVLIIAAFPLPYGYYTFTRIVICLAAAVLAYSAYTSVPVTLLPRRTHAGSALA